MLLKHSGFISGWFLVTGYYPDSIDLIHETMSITFNIPKLQKTICFQIVKFSVEFQLAVIFCPWNNDSNSSFPQFNCQYSIFCIWTISHLMTTWNFLTMTEISFWPFSLWSVHVAFRTAYDLIIKIVLLLNFPSSPNFNRKLMVTQYVKH